MKGITFPKNNCTIFLWLHAIFRDSPCPSICKPCWREWSYSVQCVSPLIFDELWVNFVTFFRKKKADYLLSVLVRVFFAASRCPIILRFYYLGVIITDWKSPKDTAHTELGYFLNRYFSYTHNIYTEREREREREISEKAEMKTSFISPKCLTLILISRSREFTTNWWFTLHDSECNFMSGLSMQGEK